MIHNSSACHSYIMWAELGHIHFYFYMCQLFQMQYTGTKNVLKWNRALRFVFSIQSCVYGATTVAKVTILNLDTVYCKFSHYVSIEIDPYSCE